MLTDIQVKFLHYFSGHRKTIPKLVNKVPRPVEGVWSTQRKLIQIWRECANSKDKGLSRE